MVVGREGGEREFDAFIAKDMDRYNLAHARAEGRPMFTLFGAYAEYFTRRIYFRGIEISST